MEETNDKSLKIGNYEFRVCDGKVILDVRQPNSPIPVFTIGYGSEQFAYGLLCHLMDQRDETALVNFGVMSFAMNSLFAANAEFRNEVQNLIYELHISPDKKQRFLEEIKKTGIPVK